MVDSKPFAPKDAETIKSEILEDLGLEYEGNEEMVDKLVTRGLKDEEFKANMHADKNKHLEAKRAQMELMKKAGLNPETGEKIDNTASVMSLGDIRALNDIHDDDVDEIRDYAKSKGITIAEAKKTPFVKTYLETRKEERKAAEAASTTSTRRTKTESSEHLLTKVDNNEDMSDDERKEAAKLLVAKLKG